MLTNNTSSTLIGARHKLAVMTDTLGERLREARGVYRLSQGDLARKIGITPAAISQWESGQVQSMKPRNLLAAARALGVDVNWLVYGKGRMRKGGTAASTRICIVPWGDAARFDEAVSEGKCTEYVDAAFDPSDDLFAVIMPDTSMEPMIHRGATLVVDSGMEPRPADYVLARHMETGDISCRQLVRDGGLCYLKAENQAYPMHLAERHEIIGVVREVMRRFR